MGYGMDSNNDTLRNLTFLLSMAPLGLGCIITTTDDDGAGSSGETNPPNTSGESTGDVATGGTTDAATGNGETGGTTEGATGNGTTEGPVDSTGDSTGEPPSLCEVYADHISYDCIGDPKAFDIYYEYCYQSLGYADSVSPECYAAMFDLRACLSEADCLEIGKAIACTEENDAVISACSAG